MTNRMLIVGATSGIAQEIAKHFANDGFAFALAGRDPSRLAAVSSDLIARGATKAVAVDFDAVSSESAATLFARAEAALGELTHVVIAHGLLGNTPTLSIETQNEAPALFQVNTLSAIAIGLASARAFETRKSGSITFISSVAGERGRKTIMLYGATKAALTSFASGLRNYLGKTQVHVLTVLPGVVRTSMTAHLKHGALSAQPEKVGADIYNAIKKRRNVLYTPCVWMGIMAIIRNIPEVIFKKLSL